VTWILDRNRQVIEIASNTTAPYTEADKHLRHDRLTDIRRHDEVAVSRKYCEIYSVITRNSATTRANVDG